MWPMANSEQRDPRETLHLLLAFRRRKDNPEGPIRCCREIIRDEPVDLERLKVRLRQIPGVWRIHRTVNVRNVAKASKVLQHRLLDNPDDAKALETVWKTCLLQKESRVGRRMLLDIDDAKQFRAVVNRVFEHIEGETVITPSGGYHVVCSPFDTRILEGIPGVTVQRDGYVFLERFEVSNA